MYIKHPLLVCDNSINLLEIGKYFDTVEVRLKIRITKFTDFQPNPTYESVVKGVQVFRQNACDCIEYLRTMFGELAEVMGCNKAQEAAELFQSILSDLHLEIPTPRSDEDYELLKNFVNPVRLKNNPVKLDKDAIDNLYNQILGNIKVVD